MVGDNFDIRFPLSSLFRFVRFCAAGLSTTAFYLGLTLVLASINGISPTVASTASYFIALMLSYLLQSRFAFRMAEDSARQITRFLVTAAAGLIMSFGVMALATDVLGFHYFYGAVGVCIIVPIISFIAFSRWVFVHRAAAACSKGYAIAGDDSARPQIKDTELTQDEAKTGRADVTQQQVADDFDRLTESYGEKVGQAIAFAGMEHTFYIDVKRAHLIRLSTERFGETSGLDVLDLGCGIGAYHKGLRSVFRELHGVDVSTRSIDAAAREHTFVTYRDFDGRTLPYPDERFHVVFTICVMHHVPPLQWAGFVVEMKRVLRPGGLALVFEHNPYNPVTQYIVKSCEIDKGAVLLKPGHLLDLFSKADFEHVATKTILSVPPKGAILSTLDGLLGHLPFGAQYYLRAIKRN